jgi:hypothetical protein
MISMNMRDYAGSTPYTPSERAEVGSPDLEVQSNAIRRRAREISAFLLFLCKTLNIPPLSMSDEAGGENGRAGGFVLLCWSLANMFLTSMLGDPMTLDEPTKSALSPFWRKAIIYGALHLCA